MMRLLVLSCALAAFAPPARQAVPAQKPAPTRHWAGHAESPARIAVTSAGELLVSDYSGHRVVVLDPPTMNVRADVAVGGRALAVGALGDQLLVGNESLQQVQIYARDGTLLGALGGGGFQVEAPTDLDVDVAAGRVFVVDGGARHVKVFDTGQPERPLVATIGAPGSTNETFQNPTGIVVDPDGQEVYVSDYGDLGPGRPPRVLIFGYDGTFHDLISGDGGPTGQYFGRPQGLALGVQPDHVFVVDGWRGEVVVMHRVLKTQVGLLGGYGRGRGELRLPLDAVIHGPASDLVVTSNANRRIEVFAAGGQL